MLIMYFYLENGDNLSDDASDNGREVSPKQTVSVLTDTSKANIINQGPSTSMNVSKGIKIISNVPAKQHVQPVYIESELCFFFFLILRHP